MKTKITENKYKIPSITGLVTTLALNTKVTEKVNKILNVINVATKAAFSAKANRLKIKELKLLVLTLLLNSMD